MRRIPRPSQNTPMSERQQMALLIQMTANSTTEASRTHIKKQNEHKKPDDPEDANASEKHEDHETVKEKSSPSFEEVSSESRKEHDSAGGSNASDVRDAATSSQCKRPFSDVDDDDFEDSDDIKKKKRKDSDSTKESKNLSNLRLPARNEKSIKQGSASKNSPTSSKIASAVTEKDQPENAKNSNFNVDVEDDDCKMSLDSMYSGGLKVPPLKIVIPQQNCSIDTDGNISRTGKINASRNAALPYVVSSNNETSEREMATGQCNSNSPHESPVKVNQSAITNVIDEKNIKLLNEEKNLHRVLRSSHRSGVTSVERSSNNSSPQMQSSSPSPASSNAANDTAEGKISFANIGCSPLQQSQNYEHENIVNLPSPSTSSTSSSKDVHSSNVDLHPRKRKIRSKNDDGHLKTAATSHTTTNSSSNVESSAVSDSHPHDFPFTNCFQMYLNIRRQIEKKWKNLYPVKPRPPQGYNEYLINKKTYLLAGNEKRTPMNIPNSVPHQMREIYLAQEKDRQDLLNRHIVEREKLCLNVEQEIIRVHSKAARNISCQSMPYSVCTLLKDEEVYNVITPDQEEKDKNANARYRFNGRLLLSWLQDVDDKWDKIKEAMVLRHHNEAESLHAVQLMDWEIALRKLDLCDYKSQLVVDKIHVPIVFVSDDFDLLPA